MSQVSTIGLDIAKQVFHVHGADERGVWHNSRRDRAGRTGAFQRAAKARLG